MKLAIGGGECWDTELGISGGEVRIRSSVLVMRFGIQSSLLVVVRVGIRSSLLVVVRFGIQSSVSVVVRVGIRSLVLVARLGYGAWYRW